MHFLPSKTSFKVIFFSFVDYEEVQDDVCASAMQSKQIVAFLLKRKCSEAFFLNQQKSDRQNVCLSLPCTA